jgi:probable phosphoglycerate mutase
MTRLLLVRHGQSTWNAEGRWQGHADPPLSPLGERQARAAAPAVAGLGVTALFSSDLLRAHQTAEILAPPGLTPVLVRPFRERNVGEWEGLTRVEIEARFPGMLDAHESPPGFESDESLMARVLPALDRIVGELADDAVVLIATHGGVIRTLERHLGTPPAPMPNLGGRWVFAERNTLELGDRVVLADPDDVALTTPEAE